MLLEVVAEDLSDNKITEDGPPLWIKDNVCTGDTVPVWTDVPGRRRKAMVVVSVRVSVKVARLVTMDNWKVVWVTESELVEGLPRLLLRQMLTRIGGCCDGTICKARLGYHGMKRGCGRGDCNQAQYHTVFGV